MSAIIQCDQCVMIGWCGPLVSVNFFSLIPTFCIYTLCNFLGCKVSINMIASLLECIRICLFISHYSYDSFLDVAKLVLDNCYLDECTPETKLEFVEDFDYGYAVPYKYYFNVNTHKYEQ